MRVRLACPSPCKPLSRCDPLLATGFPRPQSRADGGKDIYWQSRESSLLIRGGANYAYDQINEELAGYMAKKFGLGTESVSVAVIGLRLSSEHDDDACVTIELKDSIARGKKEEIRTEFLAGAKKAVSKGAKPDCFRFGSIPRNFKGAVLVKDVVKNWKDRDGKDDPSDAESTALNTENPLFASNAFALVFASVAVVLVAVVIQRSM